MQARVEKTRRLQTLCSEKFLSKLKELETQHGKDAKRLRSDGVRLKKRATVQALLEDRPTKSGVGQRKKQRKRIYPSSGRHNAKG